MSGLPPPWVPQTLLGGDFILHQEVACFANFVSLRKGENLERRVLLRKIECVVNDTLPGAKI